MTNRHRCTLGLQGQKLREVPPYADIRAVAVELSAARLPERQRLLAMSTLPQLPAPWLAAPPAAPAYSEPPSLGDSVQGSAVCASVTKLDTWLLPALWLPREARASESGVADAAAEATSVASAAGPGSAYWLGGAVRRQRTTAALCLPLA